LFFCFFFGGGVSVVSFLKGKVKHWKIPRKRI